MTQLQLIGSEIVFVLVFSSVLTLVVSFREKALRKKVTALELRLVRLEAKLE